MLLLFTNTANANAITYGAKKTIQISGLAAVVGVASLNVVLNSIETGKDFDKSIKILDIASKTKVTRAVYEGLFSYIILKYSYGSRPDISQSAMTIISSSKLYTNTYDKKYEIDKVKLRNYVQELGHIADELMKKYHCNIKNKYLIYEDTLQLGPEKGFYPVKEWDYGSYKFLYSIHGEDDYLEHDHIPSLKSVYTYLEKRDRLPYTLVRDNRSPKGIDGKKTKNEAYIIGKIVEENASSIEVAKETHSKGRTYKGRMNSLIENSTTKAMEKMFDVDSENLKLATVLDFGFYAVKENGISHSMMEAFLANIQRNIELCLYERI